MYYTLIAIIHSAMLSYLDRVDKSLMLFLNFDGSPCMDLFWYQYSRMPAWILLMIVLVMSLIYYHPGKTKDKVLMIVFIALLITACDQISSGLIKPWVARLRPSHCPEIEHFLHYVNDYKGGQYGFVSSHAANMVAIVTFLCCTFRDKRTRISVILFAVLMCYSRIYLGVHYPGDILCGAVIGFILAYYGYKLLKNKLGLYTTDICPKAINYTLYLTWAGLLWWALMHTNI